MDPAVAVALADDDAFYARLVRLLDVAEDLEGLEPPGDDLGPVRGAPRSRNDSYFTVTV